MEVVVDAKVVVDAVVVVVGFDKQRVWYFKLPFTQLKIPKGLLFVETCGFHSRMDPTSQLTSMIYKLINIF